MDGLFTQCPERCPQCGRQCVRLKPHEDECQDQNARDVYCHRWRSS